MFPSGDHHAVPGTYQRTDGNIQAVGGIGGKYHTLRIGYTKQLCRCLTAGKGGFGRFHGRRMSAPTGRCHMSHGIGSGPGY